MISAGTKDNVKVKKRQPVSTGVPMPDAYLKTAKKSDNLPVTEEAVSPNGWDLLHREGIDVSHYQGTIDWQQVAAEGEVGYVYLKASEGAGLVDECYDYNLKEAKRAGLKVGSYHFFRGNATLDEQLQNMTAVVKSSEQDLVPIIDVEYVNGLGKEEFVNYLKEFLKAVTKHYGQKPMIYTFVNFYNQYLQGEGFDDYKIMIAFYRDAQPELNDGKKYLIWQFTSHSHVPGIHGNVDRSRLMDGFTIQDIMF